MSNRSIGAIVPWFGSKRGMGPSIALALGPHRAYFTLGCGSMADLFAKKRSSHETAVDLHGDLINLARVLQDGDAAPRLYERLQRTLCSEAVFDSCCARLVTEPDWDNVRDMPDERRAYDYFVSSWVGRNGVAGTERINYQMAVRWTPGGGHGAVRFRSAIESIPQWHIRLRNVMILRRDLFDVLPRIDDADGVVIYIDPPYLKGTRGGSRYKHEFAEPGCGPGTLFDAGGDDHLRLAGELHRFKRTRVVLSYYDDPRLQELYPTWTKRIHIRQKNLAAQNTRGVVKCPVREVLLANGPDPGAQTEG